MLKMLMSLVWLKEHYIVTYIHSRSTCEFYEHHILTNILSRPTCEFDTHFCDKKLKFWYPLWLFVCSRIKQTICKWKQNVCNWLYICSQLLWIWWKCSWSMNVNTYYIWTISYYQYWQYHWIKWNNSNWPVSVVPDGQPPVEFWSRP